MRLAGRPCKAITANMERPDMWAIQDVDTALDKPLLKLNFAYYRQKER